MGVLSLRVDKDILDAIEEMISFGLAKNKSEAANLLMRLGLNEVRRLIDRRKRVLKLVKRYRREGIPYKLPTLEDLMRERE